MFAEKRDDRRVCAHLEMRSTEGSHGLTSDLRLLGGCGVRVSAGICVSFSGVLAVISVRLCNNYKSVIYFYVQFEFKVR